MPQNVEFHLPFPARCNPHQEAAARHDVAWLQRVGLLPPGPETDRYEAIAVGRLAAVFHPEVDEAETALGADLLGFFRAFDDHFDGPLGLDPVAAAAVCREFTGILDGRTPEHPTPLTNAFTDYWHRLADGGSERWRETARHDWTTYFMGHPEEARARQQGTVLDLEQGIRLHRAVIGVRPVASLTERVSGYELPAEVFDDPRVERMIVISEDVVVLVNDVQSVEKDESTGSVQLNCLSIVERTNGCSRQEAIAEVQGLVRELVEEFLRLREEIPRLVEELSLTPSVHEDLNRYVADALCPIMRGNYDWGNETMRYAPTENARWLEERGERAPFAGTG